MGVLPDGRYASSIGRTGDGTDADTLSATPVAVDDLDNPAPCKALAPPDTLLPPPPANCSSQTPNPALFPLLLLLLLLLLLMLVLLPLLA